MFIKMMNLILINVLPQASLVKIMNLMKKRQEDYIENQKLYN
jgi:hypothetical protein